MEHDGTCKHDKRKTKGTMEKSRKGRFSKMKLYILICTYMYLLLIPAITFAQNVEEIFIEDEYIIKSYIEMRMEESRKQMDETKTTSIYIYFRGKWDAYNDVFEKID